MSYLIREHNDNNFIISLYYYSCSRTIVVILVVSSVCVCVCVCACVRACVCVRARARARARARTCASVRTRRVSASAFVSVRMHVCSRVCTWLVTVADKNECDLGTPCGWNMACINTPGSVKCQCNFGFQRNKDDDCVGKHRTFSYCDKHRRSYLCGIVGRANMPIFEKSHLG